MFASILILCFVSSAFAGKYNEAVEKSLSNLSKHENSEPEDNFPPTYRTINGVTVPADFPEITTEQTGETAPGLIFYATHDIKRRYFIVTNNEGDIYYYLKSEEGMDFGNPTVQPNNMLTLFEYGTGRYYVFDSTFTIVDTIRDDINSHDLVLLENGHRLSFRAGGRIFEYDKNDSIILECISYDTLFDLKRPHINSIDVDYDGHLIVSNRDLNEVVKINRETGEIIWHLGGKRESFTYINEELRLSWQHDARPIKGFPNHYLIYDNAVNRLDSLGYGTRVVEYKIDPINMTAEKVWEFSDSAYNSGVMGCSQRFENGNTFIDYIYPNTSAFEVNPVGEVIFRMNTNTTPHYRCRRYNWYGKMEHPLLNLINMQGAVHLIFHQFGDTTVNYYKIYYGLDKNNLQVADSTKDTNYFILWHTLRC